MAFLTDRAFAPSVTLNDLLHIVITGDTSQNPAGSSYKASIGQINDLFNTQYVKLTGDTMTGNLFVPNLSANTISATTYYNLPQDIYVTGVTFNNSNYLLTIDRNDGVSFTDNFSILASEVTITGGTYNPINGIVTFTNNTGGTFDVSGFTTGYTDISVSSYTYDNQNTFTLYETDGSNHSATINTMTGLTINGNLLVTGNTILSATTASTLNLSSIPTTDVDVPSYYLTRDILTGQVKSKIIPGPATYGLFAQTGNSVVVSATTVESTIINGGVGTLTIPANSFTIGDSFTAELGGVLASKSADTLRIKIKAGSIILADSGFQPLTLATNDVWELGITFTIRNIGIATVASIVTLGTFRTTKQAGGTLTGFAFNSINNTTFDTTISNQLDITAQFSSSSIQNSIYSDIFVLSKVF